ncbi:hypothetical protein ACQ4PT_005986 [Festuca glaucescens]
MSSSNATATMPLVNNTGAPAPAMLAAMAATFLLVVALSRHRSKTSVSMGGTIAGRGLPPALPGLPLVGNMHQMLTNKPVFRWLHRLLKHSGGEILRVRLGPVNVVVVTCPEMAREVLRKNDAVFADRPTTFAAESFSVGYRNVSICPYGDQWRKMRRVLTAEVLSPATESRLRRMREDEADHLLRYVHAQCAAAAGGGVIDVRHLARHFCGNVIRRLTFGRRHFRRPAGAVAGPGPDEVEHVDALFAVLSYLDAFCVSDYFPALVGLDLHGHEKVIRGVMRTLNRLHDPVIEDRVEERRLLRKAGERRDIADFLDVLASLDGEAGRPLLTVQEIKSHAIDIMIASVDNPSNAVEWALVEMTNKPEIMRKAMAELDGVVGRDQLVQEPDLRSLNYLKACIREAFRLHPGSQVILSRVGLGRNPKVWDDPLEFRPERHLLASDAVVGLGEPELRFVSFSTGRRGCPGISLGTLITVMLFARLLQGFTWSKPPGVDRVELREAETSLVMAEPLRL